MGMVKIVSAQGWDFDGPISSIVKISADGLIGHDRKEFIKRAGHAFLPFIDNIKIAKDEEPVFSIAVGAKESWGGNRNGDQFFEKVCRDYYDTFTKYAKLYRSHINKDPRESYGLIKAAAYNPTMRRIELLNAYNKTKSAAERNVGHIADKELEKLAKDGDLAGSMACSVSADFCSYCGNKARTRDEYCTAKMCKAGGCKENLAKLVKVGNDVHHLGVENRDPRFFDWSTVFRPAERTAYGHKADWLTKAAADMENVVGGAKLAEDLGVMAPLAVVLAQDAAEGDWQPRLEAQVKVAYGLDALEQNWSRHAPHQETLRAFSYDMRQPIDLDKLDAGAPGSSKMAACLGALADRKVVLPLREFARLSKRAALADDASFLAIGAIGRMRHDGSLSLRLRDNAYAASEALATLKQRKYARDLAGDYGLDHGNILTRCQLSALRGYETPTPSLTKTASDHPLAEELAHDYAVYRISALARIAAHDDDFLLTAKLATAQTSIA